MILYKDNDYEVIEEMWFIKTNYLWLTTKIKFWYKDNMKVVLFASDSDWAIWKYDNKKKETLLVN